jgi:predicted ATPase/class 3 adenylate cyclase
MNLPGGTVTFLFTDIEGSTRLWEQHPEAMRAALARYDALMRTALDAHDGVVFKTIGDAFCAAFPTASDALCAAFAAQQALSAEAWSEPVILRARMALHTGAAEVRDNDYFGQPLNRVARLLSAGHGGQVLLSAATQELARDALPPACSLQNLGEHRLRDLGRPESVFQLLHPALPSEFPPLRSLDNLALPNNLPLQLTSFIGREKAMEEVRNLLKRTRLLTLTGSGGCGKTRLSLQVGAEALEDHPDGVWMVELASLSDPALVVQATAQALGVTEEANEPLQRTLLERLKSRRLLLILDNCEHLLTACAQLSDTLLRSCPHLQILASSREPMSIAGELTYRVPSLSLPDPSMPQTPETLSHYEAVRLFIERVRFHQPAFSVTDRNAPALASVCHHLDGIPLAIELAAARAHSLSVEEIEARLGERFRLLTGGSRTALPRQQTLRAAMDWSYDLLTEAEKTLLQRLSVFAGGWRFAEAEAVCSGEGVEEWEALDLLSGLVDKSLVLYEEREGQERYSLLETVRQYAGERLGQSGEAETVQERHRSCFLALAETARPQLSGPDQVAWYGRLEAEYDNLRAALAACQETAEGTRAGLRMVGALASFWEVRAHWAEGQVWCERMLSCPQSREDPTGRAAALNVAGALARSHGQIAISQALFEESLTLYRELGDRSGMALALFNLGMARYGGEDPESAKSCYEESLALFREIGNKQGIARALGGLALIAWRQREETRAQAMMEEALQMQRETGDRRGIADCLVTLGAWARVRGDLATGQPLMEQALAIMTEIQDGFGICHILCTLSIWARQSGDHPAGHALLERGMAIARSAGDKRSLSRYCIYLGEMALDQDDVERSQALYTQAIEGFREVGDSAGPAHIATHPGHWCMSRGDYAGAKARYEEAAALRREAGYPHLTAYALVEAAHAAWCQRDYGASRAYLTEALHMFQRYRDGVGFVDDVAYVISLESFAGLAAMESRPERAARLFGAADRLYADPNLPRQGWWLTPQRRLREAACGILEAEVYARAHEEGGAMTLEQAIEYALEPAEG